MKLTEAKKIVQKWDEMKLNPDQIEFLANYITNGFNGGKALIATKGYKAKNMNVAYVDACLLLKKQNIKEALAYWKANFLNEIREKIEPTLAMLFWRRATYDITIFQKSDGAFKSLEEIPPEWRCVIDATEIKYYGKDAQKKVVVSKLADRDKAMDKLDRYIQMTKESIDLNADVDIVISLEDGNKESDD